MWHRVEVAKNTTLSADAAGKSVVLESAVARICLQTLIVLRKVRFVCKEVNSDTHLLDWDVAVLLCAIIGPVDRVFGEDAFQFIIVVLFRATSI